MEYKIVSGVHEQADVAAQSCANAVMAAVSEGWVPYGPPVAIQEHMTRRGIQVCVMQAVILPDNIEILASAPVPDARRIRPH